MPVLLYPLSARRMPKGMPMSGQRTNVWLSTMSSFPACQEYAGTTHQYTTAGNQYRFFVLLYHVPCKGWSKKKWTRVWLSISACRVAINKRLGSAESPKHLQEFCICYTTLQSKMNAKLSPHRFWLCHENGLFKTIQTIPHNLHVSFNLASLYWGLG